MPREPHPRSRGVKLPPAGHKRQEELRRRADALEAEGERRAAGREAGRGRQIKVENEIAQHFDFNAMLTVSNPESGYEYSWAWIGSQGTKSLQLGFKLSEGWEVVQGEMREGLEHKGVGGDTTRRVGDVILLRIRKDRFIALNKHYRRIRVSREQGVASAVQELAERERRRGRLVHVTEDLNDPLMQRVMKRGQARSIATKEFDSELREGTAHLPHGTAE